MKIRTGLALTILALLMTAAFAPNLKAEEIDRPQRPERPEIEPITGRFDLETRAVLTLRHPAEDPAGKRRRSIGFSGEGVGLAGPNRVALRFDTLESRGGHAAIELRIDNPLEARNGRQVKAFRGQGVAVVTLGDHTARVPIVVVGRAVQRGDQAVMLGRFHGVGEGPHARLAGSFRGPQVSAEAQDAG